jgi:hypothetical protein
LPRDNGRFRNTSGDRGLYSADQESGKARYVVLYNHSVT